MAHYQVTLNQGRTDTVTVEADSLINVKTFFKTVSTASITSIKKIVFSKSLGIGAVNTTYLPNYQDKHMSILVRNSKGFTQSISFKFPIKNISKENIIKTIKKNVLCNNEPITDVINIVKMND